MPTRSNQVAAAQHSENLQQTDLSPKKAAKSMTTDQLEPGFAFDSTLPLPNIEPGFDSEAFPNLKFGRKQRMNTSMDKKKLEQIVVPKISKSMKLDSKGQFVRTSRPSDGWSVRDRSHREDSAMDARSMSYVDIDDDEKRAVFMLPVVKRGMR